MSASALSEAARELNALIPSFAPDAANSSVTATSPHLADGLDAATITVTVRDELGDPVQGAQVALVTAGEGTALTGPTDPTDSAGVATATLTSTVPGLKSVTALVVEAGATTRIAQVATVTFTGAEISGTVFLDADQDGSQGGSEPVVSGAAVELLDENQVPLSVSVSRSDGIYRFEGLLAGTYWLRHRSVLGYVGLHDPLGPVTLTSFQASADNYIGLLETATVEGIVWDDINQDGVIDAGEGALEGVTVSASGDSVVGVDPDTLTDSDGAYRLDVPAQAPDGPGNSAFNFGTTEIDAAIGSEISNLTFPTPGQSVGQPPLNFDFASAGYALDPSNYPQNHDFETGDLTAWTGEGNYGVRSGSHDGSYYAFTEFFNNGYLLSPAFTVPADAQELSWWWRTRFGNENWVTVIDPSDGSVLQTIVSNGGTGGNWQRWTTDIQAFQGQQIQLKFQMGNRGDMWLYLDDVGISSVAVPDWDLSGNTFGSTYRRFGITDTDPHDGNYAFVRETNNAYLLSPVFTVPAEAQELSWWWKTRYSNENWVYVIDPSDGSVLQTIVSNGGTGDNWQRWTTDIQAFQGQQIRLKFQMGNRGDMWLYLDDVIVGPITLTAFTITETNPPGYASSTSDSVNLDGYGGQRIGLDFGDYTVDLGQSSLTVTPTSLTADGADTATATATMLDALGNPLPDREVLIQSMGTSVVIDQPVTATDANGQVTAGIQSTVAQTITVSALDVGTGATLPDTEQLTFVPGPIDPDQSTIAVDPSAVTADDLSTGTITVTLLDSFDNPIAGHQVEITHDGIDVTLEVTDDISDANGQVTSTIRSSQAQMVTIQARDLTADVLLNGTAAVEFVSTDPDLSTIAIEPDPLVADGLDSGTITVTLLDPSGTPLPGKPVTIQVTAGSAVLIDGQPAGVDPISLGLTAADGTATATISSTVADVKTVAAVGDGIPLAQPATVTFVPGLTSATASKLEIDPLTVPADGVSEASVTVTLVDDQGNPIASNAVSLQVSGLVAEILLPDPPFTDASGVLIAGIRSTEVGPATVTATDETAGVTLADSVEVEFVVGPTDPDRSTVEVTPATLIADGLETATVTVTLLDALDHPIAGHDVLLAVSGSNNTIGPSNPVQTDAAGVATFALTSTAAETKTLTATDQTDGVTLNDNPQVTFEPGPLDTGNSLVTPLTLSGPADGVSPISVSVLARDAFDNPIPGLAVVISATGDAVVTQPPGPTGADGKATGSVVDATAELVTLSATIDGQPIADQGTVTFLGAELSIAKSGLAPSNYNGDSETHALAGGAITYTLTVNNTGPLLASGVEVNDTLPAGLAFQSDLSGLPHQVNGQEITWQVGDLPADDSTAIEFIADIDPGVFGIVTNAVSASTATTEFDLSDNDTTLNTTVEDPRPVLEVSPAGPTLSALKDGSASLNATVRNSGAAQMTGVAIASPPTIPWVTVVPSSVASVDPLAEATIEITAAPPAGIASGEYRDFVVVSEDGGSQRQIALTVYVSAPTRDLNLTVENNEGSAVANALVTLTAQEDSVVVTEGVTQTYTPSFQTATDGAGVASFSGLELGGYDLTISAADHQTLQGPIAVVDGTGAQESIRTLSALGRILLSPSTPTLGVLRGETASRSITLTNSGVAPLTGLDIELPAAIPWLTLAAPSPLPEVAPGGSMQFSLIASPPVDEPNDIVQDFVTVTADDGLTGQAALTVELASEGVRDARITVLDAQAAAVADGEVTLVQQEPTTVQLPGGGEDTFNQHFTQSLDASSQAAFTDLEPGAYNYTVSAPGFKPSTGEFEVFPGSGEQQETLSVQTEHLTYTWEVEPVPTGFEITLTLTFDVNSPAPELIIAESCWPASDGSGVQYIELYNPSQLPLTLTNVSAELDGASLDIGSYASTIQPGEELEIPVQVTRTGDAGAGQVSVAYEWTVAADPFVTITLNPSSTTSNLIPPGAQYLDEFVIQPAVFDPAVEYTLQLDQPTELTWITLVPDQPDPMQWTSETEIALAMTADTPTFLAEGVYTDSAHIRITGSDGSEREGDLVLEATRIATGLSLHTTFELGPIPTETRGSVKTIALRSAECTVWNWGPGPSGNSFQGSASGGGFSFPSFNSGAAPVLQFDHQQVRVELTQKVMMEGEAFEARLRIDDTTSLPLEDMTVDLVITDALGADVTSSFDLVPVTPTDLGTIPSGGSVSQNWLILPSRLGVTNPNGVPFDVTAVISYDHDGSPYQVETVPERITVFPSPELIITYELPLPQVACTSFLLKTTVENVGLGKARQLSFSTSEIQVVDPNGLPINFAITEVLVDGVPQGAGLALELGDLGPGEFVVLTWKLESSIPGRFVEFTSDYKQINYEGVRLTPLLREINTFFAPGSCLAGTAVPDKAVYCPSGECPGATFEGATGQVGGPINTRTGGVAYSDRDLSVPTSAGPLTFERWYASPAVADYTEPLGFGWTHNLDTRLILPTDPAGEAGKISLKLHSANQYEFLELGDGTYAPYAGVCGTLVVNEGSPITYTFTDVSQRTYTFDENGVLLTRADPQGNSWNYSYDVDARLAQVADDSGNRFLALSYDAQGRLASVADHSGRQISFTYDAAGDLVSHTDALGQVWTYSYDAGHRLTEVVDPRGVTVERNEYDAQGRAVRQYNGENELVVELVYNANGTTTVIDALGNQETHAYDSRLTLAAQTNASGDELEKSYDLNFRPSTLTDAAGNQTALEWSEDGFNLTGVVDAAGNQVSLGYDGLNNLTSVVDARGQQTSFSYNATLLTNSTDALGNSTTYSYTPEGHLASVTDARGNTTSYTYDGFGQRTAMTDALGNTWTYSYDGLGRLIDTTDPLGRVAHNEYDPAGRLVRTTRNYDPARPQNDLSQYNIVTEYVYDEVGNQTQVIDSFGRVTQYAYDDAGRLLSVTDPAGNVTSIAYDDAGNLVATTDTLGRTTSYVYDEQDRLVQVVDALGQTTTPTYDANGNVAATTDPLGRTTSFNYDELNRQVAVTDALGGASTTTYDANGNVVAATDAEGRTTSFVYDQLNRLVGQTDPEGGVTQHSYDSVGSRIRTVDPNGHETLFVYDALNRLVKVVDHLGGETTYAYDAVGNRISVTDANSHTTSFTYDALDRLVETQDPLGNLTASEYDALGNVVQRTDANGSATSFAYDVLNRLTQQTDTLGGVTSYAYDAAGNQISMTDPRGGVSATGYDALNRPVAATDPNGNAALTAYDAVGNVTAVTDPLGQVTAFQYDALNRQVTVIDPLGNQTANAYDAVGNRTSMTDAEGVATRYEYDGLNRLTAVVENFQPAVQPDHETNVRTEYAYDPVGNRLSILDGNGHLTTFAYDALNRLVSESDPLGNTTSYGNDAVGNRSSLLDAAGFTTTFNYDAANRLVGIDYPAPDADVTFSYDAAGNRIGMQDGVGTTTWVYDDLNRTTAVTDPFGATVGYAYDAAGNRTQLGYPDGKAVGYAYDPANRLTQVTDWAALVTSYTYDAANRLATTALPNGVVSTYSYDDAGRVLEIRHESPAELLSSFVYAYDNVGNRVQAVETLRLPGEPGAELFFDDGESGGGLWIAEGTWALAGEAAHSGSFAWSDSPGADYLDGSNDSLTMANPVQLPASPPARLIFWDPIELGSGDHADVEISSDGGAPTINEKAP